MEYFENLYSKNLENLEEKDTFPGAHDLPKLNKEDIKHFSRPIMSKETEAEIISQQ
jgi:hypothetical protein